jgi:hypothetical protein
MERGDSVASEGVSERVRIVTRGARGAKFLFARPCFSCERVGRNMSSTYVEARGQAPLGGPPAPRSRESAQNAPGVRPWPSSRRTPLLEERRRAGLLPLSIFHTLTTARAAGTRRAAGARRRVAIVIGERGEGEGRRKQSE